MNLARCEPPLGDVEIAQIAANACGYERSPFQAYERTGLGNAKRLVDAYSDDMKFVVGAGWLVWDGRCWSSGDGSAMERAKDIVRDMLVTSQKSGRENDTKWAKMSQSLPRITEMLKLAQSDPAIYRPATAFDGKDMLLSVANGTIELKTGKFREHRREDFLTGCSDVVYEPKAECPRWMTFIEQVTEGDDELALLLQQLVGYCLTGSVKEQVVIVLLGDGKNGKSIFLRVLAALLGSFSRKADAELLSGRPGDHSAGRADLQGARVVVCAELETGDRFKFSLFKDLTGDDLITARSMYRNNVTFEPHFKIWFGANELPPLTGQGEAIWRRLILVPFEAVIPEERRDLDLREKLTSETELSGILNWALEGLASYQHHGLLIPKKCREFLAETKRENDNFTMWADHCLVDLPGHFLPAAALNRNYVKWCKDQGRPISNREFAARLKRRGYTADRHGGVRGYWGVGFRRATVDSGATVTDLQDHKTRRRVVRRPTNGAISAHRSTPS
jgi:putative DNA primase/helicase